MITNARQYRVTKSQAEKFRRAIDAFDEKQALTCGSDPLIVRAQINALKGQQRRLLEELAEFDALRSAPGKKISVSGLEQLPELLIKVRIARELSQKDLAELLGMKEQQIQRYEAERYQSASLHRLADIADALGIQCVIEAKPRLSAGSGLRRSAVRAASRQTGRNAK